MARRRLWSVPAGVVTGTVGVWAADLLVPSLRVDAPSAARLLTYAAIAVLSYAVIGVLGLAIGAVGSAVMLYNATRGIRRADDPVDFDFDAADGQAWPPPDVAVPTLLPNRTTAMLVALGMAVAVTAVGLPVAIAVTVWGVGLVGGPIEMSGGWGAYLAAGLIVWGIPGVVLPPTESGKWRAWLVGRIAFVGWVAVLWLAVESVDGVRLTAPDDRSVLVSVLVLGVAFYSLRFVPPGRTGLIVHGPLNLAALWILAWSSQWLTTQLEFVGWWPLVLTTLAVTAVTLPAQLVAPTQDLSNAIKPIGRSAPRAHGSDG